MKSFKAFLGLICIGLVAADVRDILNRQSFAANSFSSNVNGRKTGGTFIANNGQVVKQTYNSNGDASFSSKYYNSGNNQQNVHRNHGVQANNSPHRTTQYTTSNQLQNKNKGYQCLTAGCQATAQVNLKNSNTQQNKNTNNRNPYTQNIFLSKPSNNVFTQTKFTGKITCSAPGQICAPRQLCASGFIQDSQLAFLNSRSNTCDSNSEVCCKIQSASAPYQEQSTSCNQPNSACVPANQCPNGYIAPQAERSAKASDRCYAPEVCCRFGSAKLTSYNYPKPDNSFAAAQQSSTILTNEGYVVQKPSNQYLPVRPAPSNNVPIAIPTTRTTTTTTTTTRKPINTYLPPVDNEIPQPSNENPSILRPIVQETGISIASGCAAAMNCTPIEYCSATGVISKTPVILTPQQELFRVPMTDCRDPKTGVSGKCCRDPDYVDPWPVGLLGQYNAEILGFDDGSYKPERRRRNQGIYVHTVA